MKITFLRHGFLLPPFDDYSSLSLEKLSQLARQEIDPSIDRSKIRMQLNSAHHLAEKYDKVFVSHSRRTSDTARALAEKVDLPAAAKLKELNEILFDPSELVTESECQKDTLAIIRNRLFEALANDSNIESGKSVARRVRKLDKILHTLRVGSVLVITHGFFMRYLDIFYRQKSNDFSELSLNRAINYNYASGFTVNAD